jgi:hypothetical protein
MDQYKDLIKHPQARLEKKAYEAFVTEFEKGTKHIGQRFGQAFYEHFELHKVKDSLTKRRFEKVHALDGKKAKAAIREIFVFE